MRKVEKQVWTSVPLHTSDILIFNSWGLIPTTRGLFRFAGLSFCPRLLNFSRSGSYYEWGLKRNQHASIMGYFELTEIPFTALKQALIAVQKTSCQKVWNYNKKNKLIKYVNLLFTGVKRSAVSTFVTGLLWWSTSQAPAAATPRFFAVQILPAGAFIGLSRSRLTASERPAHYAPYWYVHTLESVAWKMFCRKWCRAYLPTHYRCQGDAISRTASVTFMLQRALLWRRRL